MRQVLFLPIVTWNFSRHFTLKSQLAKLRGAFNPWRSKMVKGTNRQENLREMIKKKKNIRMWCLLISYLAPPNLFYVIKFINTEKFRTFCRGALNPTLLYSSTTKFKGSCYDSWLNFVVEWLKSVSEARLNDIKVDAIGLKLFSSLSLTMFKYEEYHQ